MTQAMLCGVMPCHAVPCHAVLCCWATPCCGGGSAALLKGSLEGQGCSRDLGCSSRGHASPSGVGPGHRAALMPVPTPRRPFPDTLVAPEVAASPLTPYMKRRALRMFQGHYWFILRKAECHGRVLHQVGLGGCCCWAGKCLTQNLPIFCRRPWGGCPAGTLLLPP